MDDLIREMIDPPRRTRVDPARRARLIATTATVALAAAGVTSLTTSALFTDTQTMPSDFTTGTVDIAAAMSPTVTLGAGNMAPGDSSYGSVTVANAGSLELRYSISLVATNGQVADLAGELDLAVYADPVCAAGVETGTAIATDEGLPLAPTGLVGSSATGANLGDRPMGAGSTETLCFVVHLPLATTNMFQGTTADLTLTFDAEQTVNN